MILNTSALLLEGFVRVEVGERFYVFVGKMGMAVDRWHLSIEHLTHGDVFVYI